MSPEELRIVVEDRLIEQGFEGSQRDELNARILEVADQRLVFLVGLEAGSVGFEIRSLQEFFAADALMEGPERTFHCRLRAIASATSWRNVFLFAAGCCFSEREHLRDTIIAICRELDDPVTHPIIGRLQGGARLAIDILEDGLALRQPRYARAFVRHALSILRQPDPNMATRLAGVYSPAWRDEYKAHIESGLTSTDEVERTSALQSLMGLVGNDIEWAAALAVSSWDESSNVEELLRTTFFQRRYGAHPPELAKWLGQRVEDSLHKISPPSITMLLFLFPEIKQHVSPPVGNIFAFLAGQYVEERAEVALVEEGLNDEKRRTGLIAKIGRIPNAQELEAPRIAEFEHLDTGWLATLQVIRFVAQPSPKSLARALRAIAQGQREGTLRDKGLLDLDNLETPFRYLAPWPLAACLEEAVSAEELTTLADQADRGELGDLNNWRQAEEIWRKRGVGIADVLAVYPKSGIRTGFGSSIGFPVTAAWWEQARPLLDYGPTLDYLIREEAERGEDIRLSTHIVRWLFRDIVPSHGQLHLSDDSIIRVIQSKYAAEWPISLLACAGYPDEFIASHASLISSAANRTDWFSGLDLARWQEDKKNKVMAGLCQEYSRNRGNAGLVKLIEVSSWGAPCFLAGEAFEALCEPGMPAMDSAIILRISLARPHDKVDFQRLARSFAESDQVRNDTMLSFRLSQLLDRANEVSFVVRFLEALFDISRQYEFQFRSAIGECILEVSGKVRSSLSDDNEWQSLKLPNGLRSLLNPPT